jgi:hypothetical protein
LDRASSDHATAHSFARLFDWSDEVTAERPRKQGRNFKNYAAKSMDEVCEMLVEGSLDIERNPELVKPLTSFPYIASSI